MKYHIDSNEQYSNASITQTTSNIAKAIITVDTHSQSSVANQARDLLLADALLSGAGKYSRDQFLEAVNLLGASIDIQTQEGRCTFALRATAKTFPKLLTLFSTMILEPTFSSTELKRIKSTSINQLHQAKEDSKAISQEKLQNIFYANGDRKYTYSIDSSIKAVSAIKSSDLVKAHKEVLNQKWYATVGGDKATVTALEKTIKKIKQKTKFVESKSVHQPLPAKPTLSLEDIPSRQNIDLSIGLPLPITNKHPDYLPLVYAVAILGKWGGFTGRLMSTIREKEGLTYGIYARLEGFTDDEQGHLRIMTFFSPDKTVTGLTSTFRELKTLYKKGVTQSEVDKCKIILKTQQTMLQDSLGRLLNDLHSYHFQDYSIAQMEEKKAEIDTVCLTDINRVIKTYLDPSLFSVSGAGPTNSVQKEVVKLFQS